MIVGASKARRLTREERRQREEEGDGEITAPRDDPTAVEHRLNEHMKRVNRQKLTYMVREDEAAWVEHGKEWRRWMRKANVRHSKIAIEGARGCAWCGGGWCTLKHVVMGECSGVRRREAYLEAVKASMDDALRVVPKAKGTMCPCRVQLTRAAAAIRRARVQCEAECGEAAWEAVRGVIGGEVCKPVRVKDMGEAEARAVAWRMAAAIGNIQDIVIEMGVEYGRDTAVRRGAARARDEAQWQDEKEEAERVTEGRRRQEEERREAKRKRVE